MPGIKKRKIRWAISLFLVLYFYGMPAQAQYGGGSGTAEDPYLIYTAEQMNEIGLHEDDWNMHFKLMADIDLSAYTGTEFNIIGYCVDWYDYKQFTGVFDGNGHTISNFSYTTTETNYIGLFGYVKGENAEIKNLGLINSNVDAGTGEEVGSLVAINSGTITNCYVEGGRVSGYWDVGGLVGGNDGAISNCYSASTVTGSNGVGGLVGVKYTGTISNCSAMGDVSGENFVGGLLGDSPSLDGVNAITKGFPEVRPV